MNLDPNTPQGLAAILLQHQIASSSPEWQAQRTLPGENDARYGYPMQFVPPPGMMPGDQYSTGLYQGTVPPGNMGLPGLASIIGNI